MIDIVLYDINTSQLRHEKQHSSFHVSIHGKLTTRRNLSLPVLEVRLTPRLQRESHQALIFNLLASNHDFISIHMTSILLLQPITHTHT